MKQLLVAVLALTLFSVHAHADDKHPAAATAQASALTDGEIRKVDRSAAKLTIKHGPVPRLDMPAMTMVYGVKDRTLLDRVKPGDKVKFEADKLGGTYVVTRIEAAK